MAILQKIRNKGSIFIIIFVGVALFLFIIDPSTFQVLFNRNDTTIAKINKNKIDYTEFQEHYNYHKNFIFAWQNKTSVTGEEDQRLNQLAWNEIIQENIFEPQTKEVGIAISEEELEDMLFGSNIHYLISQNFTNQETGAVDTAWVRNFFMTSEDDYRFHIIADYFKRVISQERLSAKYDNMVGKGFYVPTAFAEMDYFERSNTMNFEYTSKNYKDIPDNEISFNDNDLKKYYDANKFKYNENNETREIEYIVFDVFPSSEDTSVVRTEINNLYSEFTQLEDDKLVFAMNNDNIKRPVLFISEREMPFGLSEGFFDEPVGTTSEIINDRNNYFFSYIADETVRADSVMVSHILLLVNDTLTINDVKIKSDSILNLAKNGEDFSLLAFFNSDDEGTKNEGGNIGWITEAELANNPDLSDKIFNAENGDVFTIDGDYGAQIFKISNTSEKHRKIKLVNFNMEVTPSEQTANKIFADASNFYLNNTTGEEFDQAVIENKFNKRIATINEMDNNVSTIQDARNIVKWAYGKDTKVGNVSEVFNFSDKFVIAKVSSIKPKGILPLELVKARVEASVINEKKADIIAAEFSKDLSSGVKTIAQKNNLKVDTVSSFNFSSFSVPGVGTEPRINGVAYAISENKTSEPIRGNNGVYVINVISKSPAPEKTDYTSEQLNLMRNLSGQVYRISEALQKKAKIEDYRSRFM